MICLYIFKQNKIKTDCIHLLCFNNKFTGLLFRVVAQVGKVSDINGQKFTNFGAHCDDYPCSYLTAAAGVGMTTEDVDVFVSRLDKVLSKCDTVSHGKIASHDKRVSHDKTVSHDNTVSSDSESKAVTTSTECIPTSNR